MLNAHLIKTRKVRLFLTALLVGLFESINLRLVFHEFQQEFCNQYKDQQ